MRKSYRILQLGAFLAAAVTMTACQDGIAPLTPPPAAASRGGSPQEHGHAGNQEREHGREHEHGRPVAISACGTTITTPGKYFLTADLSGCTNAIKITSSDVTLDLRGHTVSGQGTAGSIGLDVVAAHEVSIRNGTFTNFAYGVEFEGVTRSRMSGVTGTGNEYGFILNADFFSNPDSTPPSQYNQFYDNVFSHNNTSGIDANGGMNNKFRDNQADYNGHSGLYLYWANGNDIKDNQFLHNGYSGLDMILNNHDNLIQSNTALGNGTFDFADENSTALNTWKDNTFQTASRTFIH